MNVKGHGAHGREAHSLRFMTKLLSTELWLQKLSNHADQRQILRHIKSFLKSPLRCRPHFNPGHAFQWAEIPAKSCCVAKLPLPYLTTQRNFPSPCCIDLYKHRWLINGTVVIEIWMQHSSDTYSNSKGGDPAPVCKRW